MATPSSATKFFYGFGSVAYGVKDNGFAYFLLLFYNQVLGLPAESAGLAIAVALVFDAVSDPIVGHLSDNWRSRWGRRHPFMYAAALPVAASYFLLWSPPAGLSTDQLFWYLLVLAVLVRTFITLYEIPSSSLVAELTSDYDQRTSMLGYRYFFGWIGGLTIAAAAYGYFLQPDQNYDVGVLNLDGYRSYGIAASLLMLVGILTSAIGTHAHIPTLKSPPPARPFDLRRSPGELRETLSNRAFLALFCSGIFFAMANGLVSALDLYFNTYFWELSSSQIVRIVACYFVSASVAPIIAGRSSGRWGKKRASIAIATAALVLFPLPVTLRLLGLFPDNHTAALLPCLMVFATTGVTLIIAASILFSSMVADAVEDSEITTGRRSEGIFFAARSFIAKVVSGAGMIASTTILSIVGFPDNAVPGEVADEVLTNLAQIYLPILVVLFTISILCLGMYRITRDSHRENLERLAG